MAKTPLQSHSHVVPAYKYHLTLVALVFLMLLTVGASYVQLPEFWFLSGVAMNNLLAMAIATTKASLVVLVFMGVAHGTKLTKLWATLGFVWMFFMVGILVDYFARPYEHLQGWDKAPDGAMPRIRPTNEDLEKLPDFNHLNIRPRQ